MKRDVFVVQLNCQYNKVHLIITNFQLLWKSFIDFEIAQEEHEKARDLYESLLARTNHIKVRCGVREGRREMMMITGVDQFGRIRAVHRRHGKSEKGDLVIIYLFDCIL